MPHYTHSSFPFSGSGNLKETEFERFKREAQAPTAEPERFDPSSILPSIEASSADLLVANGPHIQPDGDVRFCRTSEGSSHAVVMQQRDTDGHWTTVWTLPVQSLESAMGMMGWFTEQAWRWPHFARMLHRQSADELTAWIFELMTQPGIAAARPPRHEPSAYSRMEHYTVVSYADSCPCRPARGSRLSRSSYT